MLESPAESEVLHLTTPDAGRSMPEWSEAVRDWPVPPTNPPITIPGIDAEGHHFPVEKIEAHIKGLHHQALSVFVFAGDELLLQRRALGKYHCGGQWANTCCTHPHFGEDVASAAQRRLDEELGFRVPMTERLIVEYSADVGNGLWERERVHMYRADVEKADLVIAPNPEEVCETRWVRGDDLLQEVAEHPERFTPWFRIYLERYPSLEF